MEFNFDLYRGRKIVMHCKTIEEAKDFCRAMSRQRLTWSNGDSYLVINNWYTHKKDTCYSFWTGTYARYSFYKEENYEILEWSDYMKKKFTKSDLEAFDFVVKRNGSVEIVNPNLRVFVLADGQYNNLDDIRDNLTHYYDNEFDIMKVYRPQTCKQCTYEYYELGKLVFDRERDDLATEMTMAEIEEAFGYKVKIVESH